MIEIKKAVGGYIVVVKAKNGEVLLTSEIIKTKKNAGVNIDSFARTVLNSIVINHDKKEIIVKYKDSSITEKKATTPKKAVKKASKKINKKQTKK